MIYNKIDINQIINKDGIIQVLDGGFHKRDYFLYLNEIYYFVFNMKKNKNV